MSEGSVQESKLSAACKINVAIVLITVYLAYDATRSVGWEAMGNNIWGIAGLFVSGLFSAAIFFRPRSRTETIIFYLTLAFQGLAVILLSKG